MGDPVWDATVFCKNRDRLLDAEVAAKFMTGVLDLPLVQKLLSSGGALPVENPTAA
jgi:hypothetical protein